MRITIKDIAERAGVSKTTVSFAFNDPSRISSATCARVMAIASDLGYVPDPIARTLTTKRIGAIGLLLPQPIHEALRNPYLAELIQGIGAACLEHEYALMIVPPVKGKVMEAASRAVVDALLAIGVGPDLELFELMRKRHIPLVTIDGDSNAGVPNVGIDDESAAYDLMKYVLGLGHRRIAVIRLESEEYSPREANNALVGDRRMAGFYRALAEFGLGPGDPGLEILQAFSSMDGGRKAAATVLDAGKATAVVTMADIVALGVYQVCAERGVEIPADLSIAAFDDTELAGVVRPGLTSVRQPGYQKGYVAGRELLQALSHRRAGREALSGMITMPYELIVRGSTAAPGSRYS